MHSNNVNGLWSIMPSSHRRHRQDKTVLSCELNWRQVKTLGDWKFWKQFCPVSKCGVNWVWSTWLPIVTSYLETGSRLVHKCVHTADETRQNCPVSNILRTTENCRRLSPTQFTIADKTREDSLVLSTSAVWTRRKSQQLVNEITTAVKWIRVLVTRYLVNLFLRHITTFCKDPHDACDALTFSYNKDMIL